MRVYNVTRKKVLDGDAAVARSFWSQSLGLMFSRKRSLVMDFGRERMVSLHMLFVFFSLEVLYVDASYKIVDSARLRPFTFYKAKQKARYVIELPAGKAADSAFGDRIRLK